MVTSIIKQPPHINGAFAKLLSELCTCIHQSLVCPCRFCRQWNIHGHWRERKDVLKKV